MGGQAEESLHRPGARLPFFAFSAVVTTPAALRKPADLPEQGPAAFAEALPDQAEDTAVNNVLAWLDTADGQDTVPDVPDSPTFTAFLHQLPDLSEYVAEGGCPKERAAVTGLADSEDTVPYVPDLTAFLNELPDFEYVAQGSCPKERAVPAGLGDGEDTVPDVPHFPNSLASTALLNELHDFSEYVADGDCSQDQAVVPRLGDSEDTILTASVPSLTAQVLRELPDLSEYVAQGSCPKERAVLAGLGDGEDTVPDVPDLSDLPNLTTSLNKLPHLLDYRAQGSCNKEQVAAVMLVDSENSFPDVPDSLASTASFNQLPDLLEYGAEADCPEDRLAAAMLGDTDPFWGVAGSPLQDPKGKQGGVAADLPAWLPLSPLENSEEGSPQSSPQSSPATSEETSEDTPVESPRKNPIKGPPETPLLSPLQIPLPSPPARTPPAPQRHLPRTAQLVEEALRRQPRVVLTRLPLPPGVVSCRLVPRSAEAGAKKAKRPAPASVPNTQEASRWDNIPPKKKKTVVHQAAKR